LGAADPLGTALVAPVVRLLAAIFTAPTFLPASPSLAALRRCLLLRLRLLALLHCGRALLLHRRLLLRAFLHRLLARCLLLLRGLLLLDRLLLALGALLHLLLHRLLALLHGLFALDALLGLLLHGLLALLHRLIALRALLH
jgi:hypothetical protein